MFLRQRQIVSDLQQECLEGKRLEDSLKSAIDGLELLLRLRNLDSMHRNLNESVQERRPEPSLPVNRPVTFGLGK